MAVKSAPSASSESARQGFALLVVLAMIVLVVPIAARLARHSVLARLDRQLSSDECAADSLRRQLESGPITDWLAAEAPRVVLSPGSPTPRVEVLDEQWEFEQARYAVRVTAWDQCGMAPPESLRMASPLQSSLPVEVLHRLQELSGTVEGAFTGLDQLVASRGRELDVLPSCFPLSDLADLHAIGAWVATHPVGPAGSINVNTAPLPLIEAAMQMAGRGGTELIIAARQEGKPARLPAAVPGGESHSNAGTNQLPRFVAASSSWSMRIDVRAGMARRSWWVVYQQRSGRWECVQRLVIPD